MIRALGRCAHLLLHFVKANRLPFRNSNNGSDPSTRPHSRSLPKAPVSILISLVLCLILPLILDSVQQISITFANKQSNLSLADIGSKRKFFHTFFDTSGSLFSIDPALSATVAATGLYFREGNKYEDLWIEHNDSSGCNLRQRAIVRDLLQLWVPYIQLSDIAAALTAHKNGVTGRLDRLKKVIITGMVLAARTQLRKKITREGWSQGISVEWVDLVADAPKKWCHGVARFTLLRWAVNQDDDIWLTLRGTRHNRLCGICLKPGDTFPGGFYTEAMCEHCLAAHGITPMQQCPYGVQLQDALSVSYCTPSSAAEGTLEAPETLMAPFRSMFPANGTVCAACGCGDNTIGHWTRWCIVPLLVAWILAQPGHPWATLNDIAIMSQRTATICTLVLAAFRRLLRQEGAFVHHQVRGEPKSVAWWCDTLIESTCQDATKELGVPLMHPRTNRTHCLLHSHFIDTVRVLPTEITTMHLPPVFFATLACRGSLVVQPFLHTGSCW